VSYTLACGCFESIARHRIFADGGIATAAAKNRCFRSGARHKRHAVRSRAQVSSWSLLFQSEPPGVPSKVWIQRLQFRCNGHGVTVSCASNKGVQTRFGEAKLKQ
jgi:hypothetical protein